MSKQNDNEKHPDYLLDKQVNAPSTVARDGARQYLYPDRRNGPHISRRRLAAIFLIAFYFLAPWLEIWGRPLLRIDVIQQTAYIFGLVLPMTEYSYVFFILSTLALILFLVTTLRGRIWCGYACPQTVFIEWVIRPIEEWIEGSHLKRKKQDAGPKSFGLFLKKSFKQFCFALVALVVANVFLSYFVDPQVVLSWIMAPPSEHPTAFGFVMFLTGVMYFDLGWFREQFCSFLCPYARFQSAMLDLDSPSVNYDRERGEPRGRGKDKGSCIDCGLCVRVCPTGIDIRNGLQLECIQCERCIDACDSVMLNLKRPLGLVRIVSEKELQGKAKVAFWRRPRVYIYTTLIAVIMSAAVIKFQVRDPMKLTILRQTGVAYNQMPDGKQNNIFTLRAQNTTSTTIPLKVELTQDAPGVALICPGCGQSVRPYGEISSPLVVVYRQGERPTYVEVRSLPDGRIHRLPIIGSL